MKLLKTLLPALAVGMLAGPAMAAVDNSHHDLRAWTGVPATEVCLYCHGIVQATAQGGEYGEVGDLCLSRCHSGTGFVAATVQPSRAAYIDNTGALVARADTFTAVDTTDANGAHGLDPADLLTARAQALTDTVAFSATGTALPYGGAASMECTTCHNVHDNANAPFLQRPLFTGGAAATESFCEACHTSRGANWTGAAGTNTVIDPTGEHPVNVTLTYGDVSAASRAVSGTTNPRTGRYIAFDGDVFDVSTLFSKTDLNSNGNHYQTGGHVGGGATATNSFTAFDAAGDSGKVFGCYTCHAVHQPTQASLPHLLNGAPVSANGQWNPLCVGCHGDAATGLPLTDDPNPGLTASAYFHPVGGTAGAGTDDTGTAFVNDYTYTTSTGTFSFNVNLNPIITLSNGVLAAQSSGINVANGARPRCTSCHDVHGGITNSMALVDLDGTRDGTYAGKICDSCHGQEGLPDVQDNRTQAGEAASSHHRTSSWNLAAATQTDADGDTLNMDAPSWTGITAANGLGCADCHVFSGGDHSTAHNW